MKPPPGLPQWIGRMLPDGVRRYRLDAGGYVMHVMELGQGRPVLMVHGNPTWGFLYRKVMGALARDEVRLVVPDLIGLGFSDKPRLLGEHQLEHHATWLRTLIDTLDLRGLVLVGHDWGGPIGLRAISERPDRVAGLVLLNTVASPPREGFTPTRFHRFGRMPLVSDLAFRGLGFPQNVLARAQGNPASISGDVARAYRYPLRGWRNRAAPLALARMVPHAFDHPSVEPLRRCREFVVGFRGPAAIVWGDRDPILGRVRKWISQLLPAAEVTRTQAGHFLQEEVPDEIAAAVRRVVRRAETEGGT